jgi:hypothetical protein
MEIWRTDYCGNGKWQIHDVIMPRRGKYGNVFLCVSLMGT